jgi:hypothetical protein
LSLFAFGGAASVLRRAPNFAPGPTPLVVILGLNLLLLLDDWDMSGSVPTARSESARLIAVGVQRAPLITKTKSKRTNQPDEPAVVREPDEN